VCRVQGAGCRVKNAGCRVQGAGCRVQGAGCRVSGVGRRIQATDRVAARLVVIITVIQEEDEFIGRNALLRLVPSNGAGALAVQKEPTKQATDRASTRLVLNLRTTSSQKRAAVPRRARISGS